MVDNRSINHGVPNGVALMKTRSMPRTMSLRHAGSREGSSTASLAAPFQNRSICVYSMLHRLRTILLAVVTLFTTGQISIHSMKE